MIPDFFYFRSWRGCSEAIVYVIFLSYYLFLLNLCLPTEPYPASFSLPELKYYHSLPVVPTGQYPDIPALTASLCVPQQWCKFRVATMNDALTSVFLQEIQL